MLLSPRAFRRLCEARDLLREDAEPSLSVKDVAKRVGISHFHFIRQFRAVFGWTPHQFRIRWRLEQARRLLGAGERVTDVCMEVGFTSLGSFSRSFADRVGTPPSSLKMRPPPSDGCLELMAREASPQFPRSIRRRAAPRLARGKRGKR
jgi:AraC-like DNA-binding protein